MTPSWPSTDATPDPVWIEDACGRCSRAASPAGLRYVSGTSPDALLAALAWVDDRYDGVEDYLVANGAPTGISDRLRARLAQTDGLTPETTTGYG